MVTFTIKEAQADVVSELAMCLLNGVTAAHVHHWNTLSYAQHQALGEFYDELQDLTDSLVEALLQTKAQNISAQKALFLGENGLELVKYVADQLKAYRSQPGFPQDSEIQNLADSIAELCRHTIFKLTRLS